jgi:hypothetical protein
MIPDLVSHNSALLALCDDSDLRRTGLIAVNAVIQDANRLRGGQFLTLQTTFVMIITFGMIGSMTL